MKHDHVFVGFGFGPIQAGLFAVEAYKSGNFKRIVIAEVDQKLVEAIRNNHGSYVVNVAGSDGITTERIDGIEVYNPTIEGDREPLKQALSEATEIVTSLPSVNFYDMGSNSVAELIADGIQHSTAKGTLLYTAENNNHAAEILAEKVQSKLQTPIKNAQFLNTVIGKMSQAITDKSEIFKKAIRPIVPDISRAFLVEQFNRILVTKCILEGFEPGIEVFIEKEDLLPYEEVKLYGHNAIHVLLAYLGSGKGYQKMSEIRHDTEIMQIARDAFIRESGVALTRKYAHLEDELFTEAGFKEYAEDLLERMTNPYLDDSIERAIRDPHRKLGLTDRVFGTIRLCLEQKIKPDNLAKGAAAGLRCLLETEIWEKQRVPYAEEIKQLIFK